jgi:methionyl-tRNA formyltransferase
MTEQLVRGFENGTAASAPQQGEPTLAPLLKKEDGLIRWTDHTAADISHLIRGTFEWPGAFSYFRGKAVKIRQAEPRAGDGPEPGRIVDFKRGEGLLVQCRSGRLLIRRLQPEGKKDMPADDFWNGVRPTPEDRFTSGG